MQASSITTRISVLFSCLVVLVLIVMGYVISISVTHHFEDQDRMALEGKLALVQNILDETRSADAAETIKVKLADALVGHHELSLKMLTNEGSFVFATHAANFPPVFFARAIDYVPEQMLPLTSVDLRKRKFRATSVKLTSQATGQQYRVVIAIDVGHHQVFLDSFRWQLLVVGSAGLVLMVVFGWVATRHGLRPVHEMAQVAQGISAQRIKERLPPSHLPAELRSLAQSFNGMLDRLEDALARLSDFSSDLAHELRTPVNNLMTQTQVCLSKDRSIDEYRDVLFSNMEEYERLARMISDMLFLAKADNGQIVPRQEKISLVEEVQALFEFYDALASERQLTLVHSGKGELMGDRLMLRRAMSNLLSNAIRHATPASTVTVMLAQRPDEVEICVGNQGETLAAEMLERIFERFYRADASRYRVDEGAGLGLAITRTIIRAHQGEISATSEAGITSFHIVIPVAQALSEST